MKTIVTLFAGACLLTAAAIPTQAAGTLTPVGASHAPMQIRDHHVDVVINNGFARTEVQQTFFNPNDSDLEAVYVFPIPPHASLSEVTIWSGELELNGEVLPKEQATQIYTEEKSKGNDAGLAAQEDYRNFEFRVHPVGALSESRLRLVYYQPLSLDTGVGRYLYPLEHGGTDDGGASFWLANSRVEGRFSISVELKSAFPVADVRVPGFESASVVERIDLGHYRVNLARNDAALDRDFVLYYRLADGLPGRIELYPYRADATQPETFMMVATPGVDLGPLNNGADYVYVLDVSGSMKDKIATLANGVTRALGEMNPADRFRVITFNNRATEIVPWTAASSENVRRAVATVEALRPGGGTNLYEGINHALHDLDEDRATSIVLVTDGVTNTGTVDARAFAELLRRQDIRVFGFLMGNNANWSLMQTIAETSGGFYAGVSNADDIVGQILLAKSKIAFEAMHDASLRISGVHVMQTTGDYPGKLYRGQQLVVFGRYEKAGSARVELKARITGEDRVYATNFEFPAIATENPEIERLWAMSMTEQVRVARDMGDVDPELADTVIRELGVTHQLVNDLTSMVILEDSTFSTRGIERRNLQRVATERRAQVERALQPAVDHRIDQKQPAFQGPAQSLGGGGNGGGALDPLAVAAILAALLGSLVSMQARRVR